MALVRFLLDVDYGDYSSIDASDIEMCVLGMFLTDVGCRDEKSIFRDWALADKEDPASGFTHTAGSNVTSLEEEDDGSIFLYDMSEGFAGMSKARSIKVTREQLVKLLDDWQEKVCKPKPKEVIIKHENGEFIIEIKD